MNDVHRVFTDKRRQRREAWRDKRVAHQPAHPGVDPGAAAADHRGNQHPAELEQHPVQRRFGDPQQRGKARGRGQLAQVAIFGFQRHAQRRRSHRHV